MHDLVGGYPRMTIHKQVDVISVCLQGYNLAVNLFNGLVNQFFEAAVQRSRKELSTPADYPYKVIVQ